VVWKIYKNIEFETDDFPALGKSFEEEVTINQETIGNAPCKLFSQRQTVNFAVQWLNNKK
jgi:aminoglycoside 3-N-acetyltransferase